MKKLTAREQRFVDEYFVTLDVIKAALAAGYSRTMAKSKCFQWVVDSDANPKQHIRQAIKDRMQALAEKSEVTLEKIEDELSTMAFGKTKGELSPADKLKALELLGKRRGAWKEKIEIEGGPLTATGIAIYIPENRRDNDEGE